MPRKKQSTLIASLWKFCYVCLNLFFWSLPTFVLLFLINSGTIEVPGPYPVVKHSSPDNIHELLPNTHWGSLKPCGVLFDEKLEFELALQCVNEKVWPESPLPMDQEEFPIPRCYIVSAESPDVFGNEVFNFVPVVTVFGTGAVLGFYQPESKTVFIVENVDAAMIYRHELQHLFLHLHDPETRGMGHDQDIWYKCEAPRYTPSVSAEVIGSLMNDIRTHGQDK